MNTQSNNKFSKEQAIRHWVSLIQRGKTNAEKELVSLCQDLISKVTGQYEDKKLPRKDIVAACESGLFLAACKFDLAKSFAFESYAIWWLKQGILQAQKSQILCDK